MIRIIIITVSVIVLCNNLRKAVEKKEKSKKKIESTLTTKLTKILEEKQKKKKQQKNKNRQTKNKIKKKNKNKNTTIARRKLAVYFIPESDLHGKRKQEFFQAVAV